jgi:hypothetical protein
MFLFHLFTIYLNLSLFILRKLKEYQKSLKKTIKDFEKAKELDSTVTTPTIPNSIPKRVFSRRKRKANFGELIQMDATGIITSAFFDKQETLFAYQTIIIDTINKYGIPQEVMTDRRSVFTNNKKHEHPALTQFGYSCSIIGTKITVTSIPQTKGKVERSFSTHQDRLITELKINGIETVTSCK